MIIFIFKTNWIVFQKWVHWTLIFVKRAKLRLQMHLQKNSMKDVSFVFVQQITLESFSSVAFLKKQKFEIKTKSKVKRFLLFSRYKLFFNNGEHNLLYAIFIKQITKSCLSLSYENNQVHCDFFCIKWKVKFFLLARLMWKLMSIRNKSPGAINWSKIQKWTSKKLLTASILVAKVRKSPNICQSNRISD